VLKRHFTVRCHWHFSWFVALIQFNLMSVALLLLLGARGRTRFAAEKAWGRWGPKTGGYMTRLDTDNAHSIELDEARVRLVQDSDTSDSDEVYARSPNSQPNDREPSVSAGGSAV
jgi:hypothetical protein